MPKKKISTGIGIDLKDPFKIPSFEVDVPFPVGHFAVSNENVRLGIGKVVYGCLDYNFETQRLGVGVELDTEIASADLLFHHDWENDILDIDISAAAKLGIFQPKCNIAHFEVKDVVHNTIGRAIDFCRNGVDNFIKHVSPEEREKARFVEGLKNDAMGVKNIHGLRDVLKKLGENEAAYKGNEALYQYNVAQYNYLNKLNDQVNQNTENIKRHEKILGRHEERLNQHDKILANHENRLNQHEKVLKVHTAILNNHEKRLNQHERVLAVHSAILSRHEMRLNRHERILNIHENRLNEHDRILSVHSSILRNHEEKLNLHASAINELYKISHMHGEKINELDNRMYNAENNISILGREVDIHAKILSNHEQILQKHNESIEELYDITNRQHYQLKVHNDIINDHQIAIVKLIYGYNDLKEKIENDEVVINELGNKISKVINFAIDTRDIVDGLANQTQIHKELIIQNENDIIQIKKELNKQWDFIISQNDILNDIIDKVNHQNNILNLHEKKIAELEEFVKAIAEHTIIHYYSGTVQ